MWVHSHPFCKMITDFLSFDLNMAKHQIKNRHKNTWNQNFDGNESKESKKRSLLSLCGNHCVLHAQPHPIQCSCTGCNPVDNFTKSICKTFPHADVYTHRKGKQDVGTIEFKGGYNDMRGVINFYTQFRNIMPMLDGNMDDESSRFTAFKMALDDLQDRILKKTVDPKSISFPEYMGAGRI